MAGGNRFGRGGMVRALRRSDGWVAFALAALLLPFFLPPMPAPAASVLCAADRQAPPHTVPCALCPIHVPDAAPIGGAGPVALPGVAACRGAKRAVRPLPRLVRRHRAWSARAPPACG
jgi:hypothetical protein